jgi:hypothetical protein
MWREEKRRQRQCIRGAAVVPSLPTVMPGRPVGGNSNSAPNDAEEQLIGGWVGPANAKPLEPAAIAIRGADVFWQQHHVNG